jgi:hypothetical protein
MTNRDERTQSQNPRTLVVKKKKDITRWQMGLNPASNHRPPILGSLELLSYFHFFRHIDVPRDQNAMPRNQSNSTLENHPSLSHLSFWQHPNCSFACSADKPKRISPKSIPSDRKQVSMTFTSLQAQLTNQREFHQRVVPMTENKCRWLSINFILN